MAGANTIHVTDEEFEEKVIQSESPVVVDFWAEWCGPCRAIAPVLEELSDQYQGKVTIAKVDIQSNPKKAAEFGVRGIPTLISFQNGEKKEMVVGGDISKIRKLVEDAAG